MTLRFLPSNSNTRRFWSSFTVSTLVLAILGVATLDETEAQRGLVNNPNLFVDLAKKVVPSVVHISTFTSQAEVSPDDLWRRFFEEFGIPSPNRPRQQQPRGPKRRRALGLGTGFIIDDSGLIVTNNHVVGEADEIQIRFTQDDDAEPTKAEVIGRDAELDLALIRAKAKRDFKPLPFGDSDNLEVGEFVLAVGNPWGRSFSVTHGIVSAKGRDAPGLLAKYIQTDAPINPGNSGGPLVNLKGEVIGINNAIDARAQGIGFAIPINTVKGVLPQLKQSGSVKRGYIGVGIGELTPQIAEQLKAPKDLQAPFVTNLSPGEPAEKAGVKPYDIIVEFNGKKVTSSFDLIQAVTSVPVGGKAKMKILRKGKKKTLTIAISERPTDDRFAKKDKPKKRPKGQVETGMSLTKMTPKLARKHGIGSKTKGALVEMVEGGSAADRAGIREGDIILEVNQKRVKSPTDFYKVVKKKRSYLLRIQRTAGSRDDLFMVIILDLKDSK